MMRLHKHSPKLFILATIALSSLAVMAYPWLSPRPPFAETAKASSTAAITLPFRYSFSVDGRLEEIGSLNRSTSPYWWLNSGAYLYLKDGLGRTVQGELPTTSIWRLRYYKNNPAETDDGYHPQNIFRLVLRTEWQDISEEIYCKINKYNLSADAHRAASNGLLLMNRYQDGDNLYYAGLRVDGYAVIKKKVDGAYFTLAYKPVMAAGSKYDRQTNPNLMPLDTWIGLKTEVKNLDAAKVSIKLYTDIGQTGRWTLAAEAVDDGLTYGGGAFTAAGHGGLRTDFMDVEFDDYRLTAL